MKNFLLILLFLTKIITVNSQTKDVIYSKFKDKRDNKIYKTVTIGTQTWLAENLAYNTKIGCWAYENNQSNVEMLGYLYNWEAANKGCPLGWHLPSESEWLVLIEYLGGESIAGAKLRETGLTYWRYPNTQATNEFGFNARPGGERWGNGTFEEVGIKGLWWSSTTYETVNALFIATKYNIIETYFSTIGAKFWGLSVRCIKNK
jgi:uncharacterized protein (TIGR02145 family)